MLPTRPQLQSWNGDSLVSAAPAITAAGQSVHRAVADLREECGRMPEAHGWEGDAQKAATTMFGRATDETSRFARCVDAVAEAVKRGGNAVAGTGYWLLKAAEDVDAGGELHVTDNWVVLINPAQNMSAEKAAQLQKQAAEEQVAINELLLAVGDADDAAAADVQKALQGLGFHPPDPKSLAGLLTPGSQPPGDAVPNPRDPMGLHQQQVIRDQDMATTVRASTAAVDRGHWFPVVCSGIVGLGIGVVGAIVTRRAGS
jgi:uncharacterized protein YukE